MTKLEFLAAFRAACEHVREEAVEAAIADYERQFTDQILAGETEQAIVDRFGSPQAAARKLKLSTLNGNLKQAVSAGQVAKVGVSGLGLLLLDLILVVPAIVYSALLGAFYFVALLVYLSGIFISTASLAKVSYIDVPTQNILSGVNFNDHSHITIGDVEITPEVSDDPDLVEDRSDVANAAKGEADPQGEPALPIHLLRDQNFHISTHVNNRTIWRGIATTVAGMVLLVLCLLATRFSFRTLKHYVIWHFTVLRNV